MQRNRQGIEEVREAWRRSGGTTPRLGLAELTAWYERAIAGVRDLTEWRAARASLDPDEFVPRAQRERLMALPGAVEVRDRAVTIDYDVEETADGVTGVARLRLPEKVARNLVAEELPELDRPLRFTVMRGARGAVKATTLPELQDRLDDPFTDDERSRSSDRGRNADRDVERKGARGRKGPGGRGGDARGGARGGGPRGDRDRGPSGGNPWKKGPGGGEPAGGGRHRPGSPSGRGKRRGK